MTILTWIVNIAINGAVVVLLSRRLGLAGGLAAYAGVVLLATLAAGLLLRRATVESVTWRNRAAGSLLPWTALVGGGTLAALLVKNAVAGVVFGAIVATADRLGLGGTLSAAVAGESGRAAETAAGSGWSGLAIRWLTVACWLLLLVAWLWVLRAVIGNHSEPISTLLLRRSMWIPLLIPHLAIGGSMFLRYQGHPIPALLSAGIPVLIVLLPALLIALVILGHMLMGKPLRWN